MSKAVDNMKVCASSDCWSRGLPQTLSEFHKDTSRIDGYNVYCKFCMRKRNRRTTRTDSRPRAFTQIDLTVEQERRWERATSPIDPTVIATIAAHVQEAAIVIYRYRELFGLGDLTEQDIQNKLFDYYIEQEECRYRRATE